MKTNLLKKKLFQRSLFIKEFVFNRYAIKKIRNKINK